MPAGHPLLMVAEAVGGGESFRLDAQTYLDEVWGGSAAFAYWECAGGEVVAAPLGPAVDHYNCITGADPADYELIITILAGGFSSGAAGTFAMDSGVFLNVARPSAGNASCRFTAKIQEAANPGVFLVEAEITIRALSHNGIEP